MMFEKQLEAFNACINVLISKDDDAAKLARIKATLAEFLPKDGPYRPAVFRHVWSHYGRKVICLVCGQIKEHYGIAPRSQCTREIYSDNRNARKIAFDAMKKVTTREGGYEND